MLDEKADFQSLGNVIDTPKNSGQLVHIDNGASILGIAHLDHVLWSKPRVKNNFAYCAQLDNRIGVWTLLDLLPYLKCVDFDILLTDDEEICQSTGQFFKPAKPYNWIFSFDRVGTDVVLYKYEDDDTINLMRTYDFEVGDGTLSDISMMDLNCKGFNFGNGSQNQHTKMCYANLNETMDMAGKFKEFAKSEVNTMLEHDHANDYHNVYGSYLPSKYSTYNDHELWSQSYDNNNDTDIDDDFCFACNATLESIWYYCPFCGTEVYSSIEG